MRGTVIATVCSLALFAVGGLCGCDEEETLGERQISLELSYFHDSNFGSKDATGTVEIDTTTGKVDTAVEGLPTLADEVYEGWFAGGGEDPISTGRFNTDADGNGSVSVTLGDISGDTYTKYVLTVEPEPDDSPKPDPRHSIGADIP